MESLENWVKMSGSIQQSLIKIMTEYQCNTEDMLYALNHTYVALFISATRYRVIHFGELPEHIEKRMLDHLQRCFDSAKEEILKESGEKNSTI